MVNGVPIPQARMDYVVKSQIQQGQQDNEQLRKQVKEVLITRELLTQAAIQKGLDKSPEVVTGVEMARQEFLIRAYFDDFIKNNAITDEELRAEYEKVKAAADRRRRAQGVPRPAHPHEGREDRQGGARADQQGQGQELRRARQGQVRRTTAPRAEGGQLDWSDGSNFVPEFAAAMTKLGKGEWTTQLVKTKYGYHIIMVEDIRDVQFPPFDQVKDRINQQLMAQKRDKAIEALKEAQDRLS